MFDAKSCRRATLGLACLLLGPAAAAQEPEPAPDDAAGPAAARATAREADTQEALALLERSLAFLDGQERFRFVAHTGYDALQATGQKLEFGGSRTFLVRRPDRMRVELESRDGETATLFFDGTQIAVSLPAEKAYAAVAKTGTLDQAIDYLQQDLQEPAPLLELVHTRIYPELVEKIRYGFHVGEAMLAGRRCDHLAFQGDEVDFQIWIEQGERPLPVRLVITYKQAEASPQFWAQLVQWQLGAEAPDGQFQFTPPEGAERLPFAPRARRGPSAAGGR